MRLGLLKTLGQLTSEFLVTENLQIFESLCMKLTSDDQSYEVFEREAVRFFFLNLHYLWGDWLFESSLGAPENLPDRPDPKKVIQSKQQLHSVPIVKINVQPKKVESRKASTSKASKAETSKQAK